ncbi:MAG: AAA family ATPase [Rhizobiaceae bacterium]
MDDEPGRSAELELAKSGSKPRYVYYIVGCPAAGKTTLLENLRCFQTIEEWTQKLPDIMYGNFAKLSAEEQEEIDRFLDIELVRKGKKTKANDIGITVVDRAPLDLYAFSKSAEENMAKTENLRNSVLPALDGKFDNGHVIFLQANKEQLALRQARRGRANSDMNYTGEQLERQGKKLRTIYRPMERQVFDNSNQTDLVTALKVARHILFDEYNPTDFDEVMERCMSERGGIGLEEA